MPKRPVAQMLVIGVIGLVIGIPVALLIPWFPTDASLQAGNFRTLYKVLLVVSVPIFVLVETVVLYSVWKFRMRPGEEEKDGPPIHGNTRLEVIWTAMPAVLILGLCTYAYAVLRSNEKAHPGSMVVNVTARQFAFEFSYPQSGGKQIVSSELYLPKGRPVLMHLRSLDVIHSFFVPDFSEKIDAVPGITTDLRVTPTQLGTFPGECTELCGAGHSLMRGTVRVVSPAAFKTWLSAQKAGAAPPLGTPPATAVQPGIPGAGGGSGSSGASGGSRASGGSGATGSSNSSGSSSSSTSSGSSSSSAATSPAAGKVVFTGTAGCSGCHTLAAAGATGTVGPNLDQRLKSDCATAASIKIRGSTLSKCIDTAITNPYAYLPSGYAAGVMPKTFSQTLSSTQIQALVNFLAGVAK